MAVRRMAESGKDEAIGRRPRGNSAGATRTASRTADTAPRVRGAETDSTMAGASVIGGRKLDAVVLTEVRCGDENASHDIAVLVFGRAPAEQSPTGGIRDLAPRIRAAPGRRGPQLVPQGRRPRPHARWALVSPVPVAVHPVGTRASLLSGGQAATARRPPCQSRRSRQCLGLARVLTVFVQCGDRPVFGTVVSVCYALIAASSPVPMPAPKFTVAVLLSRIAAVMSVFISLLLVTLPASTY